jgi:hypothetical protein
MSIQSPVRPRRGNTAATHLEETDSSRLLAEALTAEVEAVFADKTSLMSTHTAMKFGAHSVSLWGMGTMSVTDH